MNIIENRIQNKIPFNHYTFNNVLDNFDLTFLSKINLKNSSTLNGKRTSNKNRFFITKKDMNYYCFKSIVNYFLNEKIINFFEKESNRKIRGNYLRVEILEDKDDSYLEPHCDIKEKILSLMIYLNESNEDESIGTSLYDKNKKLIKTVPYINNSGFYFYPDNNTWHGLEKIKLKNKRKAIMVNYCTFKTEFKVC